jgi:hypothetical protein
MNGVASTAAGLVFFEDVRRLTSAANRLFEDVNVASVGRAFAHLTPRAQPIANNISERSGKFR